MKNYLILILAIIPFISLAQNDSTEIHEPTQPILKVVELKELPNNDEVLAKLTELEDKIGKQNILSILVPLFVVIIAGYFSLLQIKKNIKSEALVKWNEQYRAVLADYIEMAFLTKHHISDHSEDTIRTTIRDITKTIKYDKQLKLFLNPIEHKKIFDFIDEIRNEFSRAGAAEDHNANIEPTLDNIIEHSHTILKENWKVVKSANPFK